MLFTNFPFDYGGIFRRDVEMNDIVGVFCSLPNITYSITILAYFFSSQVKTFKLFELHLKDPSTIAYRDCTLQLSVDIFLEANAVGMPCLLIAAIKDINSITVQQQEQQRIASVCHLKWPRLI